MPNRYRRFFGHRLCQGFGLVKTAFSSASGVKRNRHQTIDGSSRNSLIFHRFKQDLREQTSQVILAPVFESMDQISDHALGLVNRDCTVECQRAIFTVRAVEWPVDFAGEGPRAARAKRRLNPGTGGAALLAKKYFRGLRQSASSAVRRVKKLDQCLKQQRSQVDLEGR